MYALVQIHEHVSCPALLTISIRRNCFVIIQKGKTIGELEEVRKTFDDQTGYIIIQTF